MKHIIAVLFLVHATLCLGSKLVLETNFGRWQHYTWFKDGSESTYKFLTPRTKFTRGSSLHPLKSFSLRPQYYRMDHFSKDGEIRSMSTTYQTLVNLYYDNFLLDRLRVKTIDTKPFAEIPDSLTSSIMPLVTKFDENGHVSMITIYYRMDNPCNEPCYYQNYIRIGYGGDHYVKSGYLYPEPDEEICIFHLGKDETTRGTTKQIHSQAASKHQVRAVNCLGPKLVTELGFELWPGYSWCKDGSDLSIKYLTPIIQVGGGQKAYPVDSFSLRLKYYKLEHTRTEGTFRKRAIVTSTDYQTIVYLYYADVILDRLRIKGIDTEEDGEIHDGIVDGIRPVVTEFTNDGVVNIIKVYYSMEHATNAPCSFQIYVLSEWSGAKSITKRGSIQEEKDEKVCKKYLERANTNV